LIDSGLTSFSIDTSEAGVFELGKLERVPIVALDVNGFPNF
jgi:hypothetical protein